MSWESRPKPYVVAFDISRRKTRDRVRKILKDWRIGGQKSVYECWLTPSQAEDLFIQLGEKIDTSTDNLLMVRLKAGRDMLARGCGLRSRMFEILWRIK